MKRLLLILIPLCLLLQSCSSGLLFPPVVDKIYAEKDAAGTVRYYTYFWVENNAGEPCEFTMEDNDGMHFQLVSEDYLKPGQPVIYHKLAPHQIIEVRYEIKNWSGPAPGVFASIRMTAQWANDTDEEQVVLEFPGGPDRVGRYYVKDDHTTGQYFSAYIGDYLVPNVNEPQPHSVSNGQVHEIYNPNDFAVDIVLSRDDGSNCLYSGALRSDPDAHWLNIPPHRSTSGYGTMFTARYPNAPCANNPAVSYVYSASSQYTINTLDTFDPTTVPPTATTSNWIGLRYVSK